MAKKATGKPAVGTKGGKKAPSKSKSRAIAKVRRSGGSQDTVGEALVKLLQSPLVADLVAVAATAALASLAEQGFTSRDDDRSRSKRASKAVKAAGKAAAAAVGRRLNTEIDEIKKASKQAKGGAKA